MATFTLFVNTTADQNDGNAANGLSLRDAIIIANADPNNDFVINLTGGATYQLTAESIGNDTLGGDLDILNGANVTLVAQGQPATIDASRLVTRDRVFDLPNRFNEDDRAFLSLNNIIITGGSSITEGGGIFFGNNTQGLLINTIVTDNYSGVSTFSTIQGGGGIANDGGSVVLINSTVTDNEVENRSGGGIFSIGSLTLINTTVSNNLGSGVSNALDDSTVTIINSAIINNQGRGLTNRNGSMGLNNTTVSGNKTSGVGGGIFASQGVVNITNSTITGNSALDNFSDPTQGGGIYSDEATINLKNTSVTGNISDENPDVSVFVSIFGNISASVNGNANNLIGSIEQDLNGTLGTGTDIINPNAGLGPLQNNGGATLTHALLEGSPAVNAGNNAFVSADSFDFDSDGDTGELIPFDQRGGGFFRVANGTVDIGAFEVQPPLPSISINDVFVSDDPEGLSNAVFTVTLNFASPNTVTVQYTTQDNSAVAGVDYIPVAGTLSFTPGQTAVTVTVPIIADTLVEPSEVFSLLLSNSSNAGIGDNLGFGIVVNLDPAQYGASNTDLIAAFGYNLDALRQHYYTSGVAEARSPDSFDELRYVASSYPTGGDLIAAFGLNGAAATQHYITNGAAEGRSKTAFDPARYLLSYPSQDDLLSVFGTNTLAATQHYITNGYFEGRNPNLFPSDRYIASHPDLIKIYGYNLEAGSSHYLLSGIKEARPITFDPVAYLNRHSDVNEAYGGDLNAAARHYIEKGFGEGRPIA